MFVEIAPFVDPKNKVLKKKVHSKASIYDLPNSREFKAKCRVTQQQFHCRDIFHKTQTHHCRCLHLYHTCTAGCPGVTEAERTSEWRCRLQPGHCVHTVRSEQDSTQHLPSMHGMGHTEDCSSLAAPGPCPLCGVCGEEWGEEVLAAVLNFHPISVLRTSTQSCFGGHPSPILQAEPFHTNSELRS